ncbi:MAG: beta-N-acetylhexosaminidase [Armatimonadetes bacterium]|nr:beta-N-acetylhexosaminidase [Armatimonadota bacterium]
MIAAGRDARCAAARLCLVDFPGPEPSARLEGLIADLHIGGVCLFRKNVVSPAQVAGLTAALQGVARDAGAPPLWVSIDHEGGAVNRFPVDPGAPGAHVTPLPGAMALGAAGDPELAREAGRVAGRELRALGIHLNFAPVMDVNNNPANPIIGARAFGESPALVEAMGLAYIVGLQDAGVAATAKHFPGHGDVTVDSHLALPLVPHETARLEAIELPPFTAAVRAGVGAVMSAHIVFPALDRTRVPATMSGPILTGLLRERWGYQGVVCSDSLSMRAIVDHYGVGGAAVAAVGAGCDLLLALGPDALQDEVLQALAQAIDSGALPGRRVAEALARVKAAARRWRIAEPPSAEPSAGLEGVVGTADHAHVARRIAEAAVTLVRDQDGIVPFVSGRIGVVTVSTGLGEYGSPDFAAALRRQGVEVRQMPAGAAHEIAGGSPAGVDDVVAVTCTRGPLPPEQVAVVRDLHGKMGNRLVLLAAGDPHDLMQVPDVHAYLACYSPDGPSLDAAARVLVGQIRPRGRLPVSLPGLYPAGHGLGVVGAR